MKRLVARWRTHMFTCSCIYTHMYMHARTCWCIHIYMVPPRTNKGTIKVQQVGMIWVVCHHIIEMVCGAALLKESVGRTLTSLHIAMSEHNRHNVHVNACIIHAYIIYTQRKRNGMGPSVDWRVSAGEPMEVCSRMCYTIDMYCMRMNKP